MKLVEVGGLLAFWGLGRAWGQSGWDLWDGGGGTGHEVSQMLFHAYSSGPGVRPRSVQRVGCKAPADRNCK